MSHLRVGVLNRGDVGVSEGAFNKPKNKRALSYPSGSKHHHPVVITLLRHSGSWSPPATVDQVPGTSGRAEKIVQQGTFYVFSCCKCF